MVVQQADGTCYSFRTSTMVSQGYHNETADTELDEIGEPKMNGDTSGPADDRRKESSDFDRSWRHCCFVSALPFTFHFGFVNLVTSALGTYLTSQITTLEKQFGLSSSESGVLMSMNDAGFLITVVFISYFGRHSHIPKILALSGVLYGISALICVIPHFFAYHEWNSGSEGSNSTNTTRRVGRGRMCSLSSSDHVTGRELNCSEDDQLFTAAKPIAMGLISLGMFLQGIAKSPRQPLSQTYIDDNIEKTKSGFYIGIILCLAVIGPATSYSIGGTISRIYVTLEETGMSPRDPRWIGAWWIGFVAFGSISFVLALPLLCYPKRFNQTLKKDGMTNSSIKKKSSDHPNKTTLATILGVLRAFKRLACRPVYVFLVMTTGFRVFSFAGVVAFTPKYMQVHYGLSIFKANIYIGFVSLGAAAAAIFLSGILARALKLELRGMIRLSLITQVVSSLVFFAGMFLSCPQPAIHNFDIHRIQANDPFPSSANISTSCYSGCGCKDVQFFPICGSDNITYFSPCHAGCKTQARRAFKDCSCISNATAGDVTPVTSSVQTTALTSETVINSGRNQTLPPDAKPGMCKNECSYYIGYIVIQFLSSFISGLSTVPGTLALIRAVDEKDKALALGFNSFVASLFGWFLGPIVMGAVIDTTCKLWNVSCSEEGSCAVYDITDLRHKLHGIDAGLSLVYIFCTAMAYLCLTKCRNSKVTTTKNSVD